jgi:serine protease Do
MQRMLSARRRVVGLVAGLCCLAGSAHAELDRAKLVQVGGSVLKVEAQRQQGGYSLGSGVVVGPGLVVTNCHVTHDAIQIHVLRAGDRIRVQSQVSDAVHDLCLLRVPGISAAPVVLGSTGVLKPQQAVTAVGYTGGLGIQSSAGTVVALHRYDGGHVVQSTNWFTSGASGGALFDDDMRLVGVLTFRLRGGDNHYFAAPVEWLAALLQEGGAQPLDVAPAPATSQAYWQRQMVMQPNFLQAITLERDRNWTGLETLAKAWCLADSDDAAPWVTQALALDQQGRLPEAQKALERAVDIDPQLAQAWFKLGLLHQRQNQSSAAQMALRRLRLLDPALAQDLHIRLGKS